MRLKFWKYTYLEVEYLKAEVLQINLENQQPEVFYVKRCNFIKKETVAQVFSCEFCEISKTTFFTDHLWTIASKPYKWLYK